MAGMVNMNVTAAKPEASQAMRNLDDIVGSRALSVGLKH